MDCMPNNAATRRYSRRLIITMALYAILLLISLWTFRHHHPVGVIAYLLAILPALPILASLGAVGLYIVEEHDEFQRNIFIQSMLWGIGLTMALLTIWGFLELLLDIPRFQTYLTYPLFWGLVGITSPFIRRSYR